MPEHSHNMDSPYDSDVSDGMKELIRQGFAIKRGRECLGPELGYLGEIHTQVHDTDVSHVPLRLNVSAGVASTHGLTTVAYELATARGRNTGTREASLKLSGNPVVVRERDPGGSTCTNSQTKRS